MGSIYQIFAAAFLVSGTVIGGGLLAMPIVCAKYGFVESSIYLFFSWIIILLCALYILKVNMSFPIGVNLANIGEHYFGKIGRWTILILYLFFVYFSLAAYTKGASSIFVNIGQYFDLSINYSLSILIYIVVLGLLVCRPLPNLYKTNFFLVSLKIIFFIFVVYLAIKQGKLERVYLNKPEPFSLDIAIVGLMSFGFAGVIPSLRIFLLKKESYLRVSIIIGAVIPLFFYIIWNYSIMSLIGTSQLKQLSDSNDPIMIVYQLINSKINSVNLAISYYLLTILCITTSFYGLATALLDFIIDTFGILKTKINIVLVFLIAFVPPYLIAEFFQEGFVTVITYSGYMCMILQVIFPILLYFKLKGNAFE